FRIRDYAKVFAVPLIDAILEGKNVKVFWESENDNSIIQYEIEHSTDGTNFSTIGRVLAEINSKQDYIFNHTQPPQGINYYRLKITMIDGTTELSSVINILVPEFESKIRIYPNPIKDSHIQIHFSNQLPGKYALILYNLIGQKLLVKEIEFPGGNKVEIISLQKNNFQKVARLEITKPNGDRVFIPVAQ
ncbi:MAG TPA: T9SS type A sorting domain-containing protein, partial [Hanamia sp.]